MGQPKAADAFCFTSYNFLFNLNFKCSMFKRQEITHLKTLFPLLFSISCSPGPTFCLAQQPELASVASSQLHYALQVTSPSKITSFFYAIYLSRWAYKFVNSGTYKNKPLFSFGFLGQSLKSIPDRGTGSMDKKDTEVEWGSSTCIHISGGVLIRQAWEAPLPSVQYNHRG